MMSMWSAAELLDERCGKWKLVSWKLAEEQIIVVAKDGSGSHVKARGAVIIAAAASPLTSLLSLTSFETAKTA